MIEKIYSWLLTQIRVRRKYAVLLSLIIITSWFILNPAGDPHIIVSGDSLDFDLPTFHHCSITFLKPVMVKSYAVESIQPSTNLSSSIIEPTSNRSVGAAVPFLMIENTNNAESTQASSAQFGVHIAVTPSINMEITGVSIDERTVTLKSFFEDHLKSNGEFTRLRFIRKGIADLLYKANDKGSNWILTFMS